MEQMRRVCPERPVRAEAPEPDAELPQEGGPRITFAFAVEEGGTLELEATTDGIDEFAYFLRAYILLSELMAGARREHVQSRL